MSTSKANILNEVDRQHIATEVLELGQSLFDIALEAGSDPPGEKQTDEAYPTEEIRATAQEFFTALQFLLRIEE